MRLSEKAAMMLNQGGHDAQSRRASSPRLSSSSSFTSLSSPYDNSSNLTLSSNRNSSKSRSNGSLAEVFSQANDQEILALCESLGLLGGLGGACKEAGQSTNTYGGSYDAGSMLMGRGGGSLDNYPPLLSSFMSGPSTAGEPSSSSSSSRPPRCPLPARTHTLYKTELCRGWLETGACRYGTKCQFAHGREELRSVPRHPKYKTELCRSYASTGFCAYGSRCRFIHSRPNALPSPSFPGIDWTSVLSSSASSPGRLNILGDSPAQSPLSTAHSSTIDQEAINRLLGIPGWPKQPLETSAAAAGAEAPRNPPRAPGLATSTPRGSHDSGSSSEVPSPTSGVAASILSHVRAMAASGLPPYTPAGRNSEGSADPWHSPPPIPAAAVSSQFQSDPLFAMASCLPTTTGAASDMLPTHFPGFNTTSDNARGPVTAFEQRAGLQALLSALQRTAPLPASSGVGPASPPPRSTPLSPPPKQQQQQQQQQQEREQATATRSVQPQGVWSITGESPVMNASSSSGSLHHDSLDSALCPDSLGGPAE